MSADSRLRDRLRKVEALYAGAATEGERAAAEAALDRLRARLGDEERRSPGVEMQFSLPDQWSRRLFVALCRRYGLAPYRRPRQRRTTVMLRAPRGFVDQMLWPEFEALSQDLAELLDDVTTDVIRKAVHGDASEPPERRQAGAPA